MNNLTNPYFLEAYHEQHYQSLLEEADRERLIRMAKTNRQHKQNKIIQKEVKQMLKRRLAYLAASVVIVALYIAQAAQAAAGGGGGGGLHLVM